MNLHIYVFKPQLLYVLLVTYFLVLELQLWTFCRSVQVCVLFTQHRRAIRDHHCPFVHVYKTLICNYRFTTDPQIKQFIHLYLKWLLTCIPFEGHFPGNSCNCKQVKSQYSVHCIKIYTCICFHEKCGILIPVREML